MGLQREMSAQTRFAWALFAVQAVFAAVFVVMVRYEDAADAAAKPTEARKHKIEETLTKYPMVGFRDGHGSGLTLGGNFEKNQLGFFANF